MTKEIRKDNAGRNIDCHFLDEKRKRYRCTILIDFYNASNIFDICGKCPFYKTDEEFIKGWRNRGGNDSKFILTQAV